MYNKVSRLEVAYIPFSTIVFLACPILALPLILWGVYKRYKGVFSLLSLFMALMAFLTAPLSDLYRHAMIYNSYVYLSYSGFWNTIENDFLTQLISYECARKHIPFDYIRLFYLFLFYLINLTLFERIIRDGGRKYTNKDYFLRFLIFFLGLNFFGATIGVRGGLALSFYVWGAYYSLCKRYIGKAIIIFSISTIIHFSFFYFVIILIVFQLVPLSRRNSIIVIAISLVLANLVITHMSVYFTANDLQGADYLGDGQWGRDAEGTKSFMGKLFTLIVSMVQIPYIIFLYRNYDKNNALVRWLVAVLIIASLVYPLDTVFSRVRPLFSSMSMFFVLLVEGNLKKSISAKFLNWFMICAILNVSCIVYSNRGIIAASRYADIYKPVPILLSSTYNNYWIYKNVDINGVMKTDNGK